MRSTPGMAFDGLCQPYGYAVIGERFQRRGNGVPCRDTRGNLRLNDMRQYDGRHDVTKCHSTSVAYRIRACCTNPTVQRDQRQSDQLLAAPSVPGMAIAAQACEDQNEFVFGFNLARSCFDALSIFCGCLFDLLPSRIFRFRSLLKRASRSSKAASYFTQSATKPFALW